MIDDGSNDPRVIKLLENYQASEPNRVILERFDQNRGLPEALNVGIKIALSDPSVTHIARMDADDICASQRI